MSVTDLANRMLIDSMQWLVLVSLYFCLERKMVRHSSLWLVFYLLYPTSLCFIYKHADGLVSVLSLWSSCWENMIDFGMWKRKTVVFIPQERDGIVLCEQNPIWPLPYRWPVMATASDSADEWEPAKKYFIPYRSIDLICLYIIGCIFLSTVQWMKVCLNTLQR